MSELVVSAAWAIILVSILGYMTARLFGYSISLMWLPKKLFSKGGKGLRSFLQGTAKDSLETGKKLRTWGRRKEWYIGIPACTASIPLTLLGGVLTLFVGKPAKKKRRS
jgi:hypothetical protein